ncbi:Smad nuclear-interacting protein 1 [Cercospora beticola]|uniref:Smad nuclear-interacting protein 1 n=1 Tax=Cercospora beticola TaxID=122368 RepID=A0A2G5HXJ3_CERBT|nr:Smad nuclear-interacting protein 1 [Cercospora beticola]PIA97240.1 Smad nuclear-interacting protein 1 [Cercospora beticola]WPA97877.1 hypothetical protein RHO25_002488 [Cercospora beticola]CAK1359077.1 unnamed protein product [Cercospora beticola]
MDSETRSWRRNARDDDYRSSKDVDSRTKRRDRSASEDERSPRKRRYSKSGDERRRSRSRSRSEVDSEYDESRRRGKAEKDENRDRGKDRRRDRRDRSEDYASDERKSSRRDRKYRDRSRSRSRTRREDERSRRPNRRSRSPTSKRRHSRSPSPHRKSRAPLPSQLDSFQKDNNLPPGEAPIEKQKPNFKPTGLLAKEANTVAGTTTVLKYHEPPEARKPPSSAQWRMYVFKKSDLVDTIQLHTRSAWLIGRDPKITDLHLEHPSISKQHAVIQFRHRTTTNEYGDKSSKVKPYVIDLDSANGTRVNGKKVEASRYMELLDQDVLKFGDSEREYVMMLPGAAEK